MSHEFPSQKDARDVFSSQTAPERNLLDESLPPALDKAWKLTCEMIGDIIENEGRPPEGIHIKSPEAPIFDLAESDMGITAVHFLMERVREDKSGNPPKTVIDLGIFHNSEQESLVEFNTSVRIEHGQIYDIVKGRAASAVENSTITIISPARIPQDNKGESTVFDMSIVSLGGEAKDDYRRAIARELEDSYPDVLEDSSLVERMRMRRAQGVPQKAPSAA